MRLRRDPFRRGAAYVVQLDEGYFDFDRLTASEQALYNAAHEGANSRVMFASGPFKRFGYKTREAAEAKAAKLEARIANSPYGRVTLHERRYERIDDEHPGA